MGGTVLKGQAWFFSLPCIFLSIAGQLSNVPGVLQAGVEERQGHGRGLAAARIHPGLRCSKEPLLLLS